MAAYNPLQHGGVLSNSNAIQSSRILLLYGSVGGGSKNDNRPTLSSHPVLYKLHFRNTSF